MTEIPSTRATAPDFQWFDEIRIVTKPRYKTSGLSGDEWRTSMSILFMKDGNVIGALPGGRDMEVAIMTLGSRYFEAREEWNSGLTTSDPTVCDQEGCSEPPAVWLRCKGRFDRRTGLEMHMAEGGEYRAFCQRHSTRGDCGIDDADRNYELIKGHRTEPRTTDESPAVFGGVIQLGKGKPDG